MTDAMERLNEKVQLQKTIAVNLKRRFLEASKVAIEDGYVIDELQNFGQKALREVIAELRAAQAQSVTGTEGRVEELELEIAALNAQIQKQTAEV